MLQNVDTIPHLGTVSSYYVTNNHPL